MIIPPAPYSYTGEVTTVDVPTLSGSYTYNGESQTPVWTYNTNAISIFGQTSGTNAGEYEVTFSLNSKRAYQWIDGTTADKTGTWSIGKANPSILFVPDYLSLTYYNKDSNVIVSYPGDGQLTYYVNNNFVTVNQIGSDSTSESNLKEANLNIQAVKTGTSYLHVDISEGTNYLSRSGYIAIDVDMSKLFNVTINSNNDTMGTVTGGGNVKEGNSVTVTATPNNNYKFVSWKSNGEVVSNSPSYTFTPTEDIELTAIFEEIPIYTVTIIVDPENSGTVTGSGQYREGVEVVINHTATEGYRFVGLKENGVTISTGKNYVFNITSDKTFTAVFEEIPVYTVTAIIEPENAGTVTGTGEYREGSTCTIVATVADGYDFTGWQENGVIISGNDTYAFTVDSDRTFSAVFEEKISFTWNQSTLPASADWRVAYGNGKFVAVAKKESSSGTGSNKAAYSTDGGVTWKSATLPSTVKWESVTYGNGKFVAIAGDKDYATASNKAAYSTDGGVTWKSATLPSSDYWSVVKYGNGKFVVISAKSDASVYSTDGVNWANGSGLPDSSSVGWLSLTHDGEKFVALIKSGGKAAYSLDGISWNVSTLPAVGNQNWKGISYGDEKFVSPAFRSTLGLFSIDGINFEEIELPSAAMWSCIAYGENKFIICSNGALYAYSKDGVNFVEDSFPNRFISISDITFGNGKFLCVPYLGTNVMYNT